MTTRDIPISDLVPGDIVIAINGKPRPFPYTVTRVINTTVRGLAWTQVRYAHGGLIPPCDPTTATATVTEV